MQAVMHAYARTHAHTHTLHTTYTTASKDFKAGRPGVKKMINRKSLMM